MERESLLVNHSSEIAFLIDTVSFACKITEK